MLALVGVMGVTAAMTVFPETGSRIMEKFSGIMDPSSDRTASWRIRGWEAQWATVKKNLLFGEGVGNYYGGLFKMGNPHNAYIQMMLKFGLLGVILYSLLVIQFFRKTLRVRRTLRAGPMKAYIEMGILTFGATHGYMFGYGIHPFALVFFGVGICAASLAQQALRRSQESRIPPVPGALKTRPRRSPLPGRPEPRPLYS
jgi:O-antigen ligase